jgi:hypothetical protein
MQRQRRQTLFALAQLAALAWPVRGLALGKPAKDLPAPGQAWFWAAYARALAAQLHLGLRTDTFKAGSGLAIANWEVINFTGRMEYL